MKTSQRFALPVQWRQKKAFRDVSRGRRAAASPIMAESEDAPYHIPVLPEEVIHALQPSQGKIFVDGTVGGGGHSELLLSHGAQVIGLDQDAEALAFAGNKLRRFGEALHLVKSNFRFLDRVLSDLAIPKVDGILLDIGVSSHQLDEANRGFSFQMNGPLDMRMNPDEGESAAHLVNRMDVEELVHIFRLYGEEPKAKKIAQHLVRRRDARPFSETLDFASCVEEVSPRRSRKHPATQIFQALRIAVNDELAALAEVLRLAPGHLLPGGRLAIITFHSLEDRMVKTSFRRQSLESIDRPEWPAPRANPDRVYQLVTRRGITATSPEQTRNPRSRSATLRVVEKL